jgi:hypothetical protein
VPLLLEHVYLLFGPHLWGVFLKVSLGAFDPYSHCNLAIAQPKRQDTNNSLVEMMIWLIVSQLVKTKYASHSSMNSALVRAEVPETASIVE